MPVDPAVPGARHPDQRLAERLAALERDVRSLTAFLQGGATQQIPVVAALPAAGRQGRLVMLASTSAIYKDTGASWVAV